MKRQLKALLASVAVFGANVLIAAMPTVLQAPEQGEGIILNKTRNHVDLLIFNKVTKDPSSVSLIPGAQTIIPNINQITSIVVFENGSKKATLKTCSNSKLMANEMQLSSNVAYDQLELMFMGDRYYLKCTDSKLSMPTASFAD